MERGCCLGEENTEEEVEEEVLVEEEVVLEEEVVVLEEVVLEEVVSAPYQTFFKEQLHDNRHSGISRACALLEIRILLNDGPTKILR